MAGTAPSASPAQPQGIPSRPLPLRPELAGVHALPQPPEWHLQDWHLDVCVDATAARVAAAVAEPLARVSSGSGSSSASDEHAGGDAAAAMVGVLVNPPVLAGLAPRALILVLDTSESMANRMKPNEIPRRIDVMQQAVTWLLQEQVEDGTLVSIVAFDNHARCEMYWRVMNATVRREACEMVRAFVMSRGSRINKALAMAASLVKALPGEGQHFAVTCLLLTDGELSPKRDDTVAECQLAAEKLWLRGASLLSVGISADHSPLLLRQLSGHAASTFASLASADGDDVRAVFCGVMELARRGIPTGAACLHARDAARWVRAGAQPVDAAEQRLMPTAQLWSSSCPRSWRAMQT